MLDDVAALRRLGYQPELALTFSLFSGLTLIIQGLASSPAADPHTPSPSPSFSLEVPVDSQTTP